MRVRKVDAVDFSRIKALYEFFGDAAAIFYRNAVCFRKAEGKKLLAFNMGKMLRGLAANRQIAGVLVGPFLNTLENIRIVAARKSAITGHGDDAAHFDFPSRQIIT